MDVKISIYQNKKCLTKTDITLGTASAKALPLMCGFIYKFDKDYFLHKVKARLIVHKELQSHQEKHMQHFWLSRSLEHLLF